jgi:hypothetical protein
MNKFIDFLIKAKKRGYAGGNQIKESDGSYSARFAEGDFRFHDNWFGGEPFGGREVVFYKEKPCWIMVYYGADLTGEDLAIPTLRKALSQMPDDFPARGPKILEDGEFKYENNWQGDINDFIGKETISKDGERIYKTNYAGGLVDQK